MKNLILILKTFFDPTLLPQQKRWIYRILTTRTKQSRYRMIDGDKRDILGLAYDQAIDDGLNIEPCYTLCSKLIEHYKFYSSTGYIKDSNPYCTLSILNDRGKSFIELANFILKNKERVFND